MSIFVKIFFFYFIFFAIIFISVLATEPNGFRIYWPPIDWFVLTSYRAIYFFTNYEFLIFNTHFKTNKSAFQQIFKRPFWHQQNWTVLMISVKIISSVNIKLKSVSWELDCLNQFIQINYQNFEIRCILDKRRVNIIHSILYKKTKPIPKTLLLINQTECTQYKNCKKIIHKLNW